MTEVQPKSMRYKFEAATDDTACFLNRLKACNSLAGTRNFRWLVTKPELMSAIAAVAAVLAIPPSSVKMVQTVSKFIEGLGVASHASSATLPKITKV